MRLTFHTDFSLRLLMYVALRPERLVTAEEVAQAYDLSKNHLMKVILGLSAKGYIETVRGRSGGIRLGKDPQAIGIGAVIRDMEGDFSLVECMTGEGSCVIQGPCRLKGIIKEALAAYFSVLDKYTLADLMVRKGPLARLLDIDMQA
jgi:Rrf2 family transcriptional regulator, nitric oxide-sensitive transcriptional repressor